MEHSKQTLYWDNVKSAFSRERLTAIVAVLALMVSIKSCVVSQNTARLAEREFYEQRLITLKADLDSEKETFKIFPTDSTLVFLKGRVYYPKELDSVEWPIDSPDYKLHIIVLQNKLQRLIGELYKYDPIYIIVLDDMSVPLVIESEYIAKGISYFDRSLYRIEYMAVIGSESKPPDITFKGLLFLGHLDPSQNKDELLSKLWNSAIKNRPNLKNSRRP